MPARQDELVAQRRSAGGAVTELQAGLEPEEVQSGTLHRSIVPQFTISDLQVHKCSSSNTGLLIPSLVIK